MKKVHFTAILANCGIIFRILFKACDLNNLRTPDLVKCQTPVRIRVKEWFHAEY